MSHHHRNDIPREHQHPKKKKLHQDWRFILAVVLMGIAIATYVLTLDDSTVPGRVPASTPTATPAR